MSYANDPNALLEFKCISSCQAVTTPGAGLFKDLDPANMIDHALFEHVVILVASGGGTHAGDLVVVPTVADTPGDTEYPLDGTNGYPDLRRTFVTSIAGSHQIMYRTHGLRRYMNLRATFANGTGYVLLGIYFMGLGKRVTLGSFTIETPMLQLGLV